jgi:5-methylcytosine-specific restriction protein A
MSRGDVWLEHLMPWRGEGSTRAWRRTRKIVLERDDYRCQLNYPGCLGEATEVDHAVNIAAIGIQRRDALDPDVCAATCVNCHRLKTIRESQAGRHRKRRRPRQHPADAPGG